MRADAMHRRVTALGAALVLAAGAVPATAASGRPCPIGAERAAVSAVADVFGPDTRVTLTDVVCESAADAVADLALPEPGSRTDGPVRFVLYATAEGRRVRTGRLTAHVAVHAPHVRSVVRLDARTPVDASAIVAQTGPVGRVLFGAVVSATDEISGRRLRRPIAADTVITAGVVDRPALVRSGAAVVTVARVHGVEVRGRAVAAQDGDLGALVIVVNPDSRKRLRGRVVGDATVEVLHVS